MIQPAEPDLLQVVRTLAPPRRFARRLYGWQQQGDKHADDGDHHQELDQRKSAPERVKAMPSHGRLELR
jgi:hypothetical protein